MRLIARGYAYKEVAQELFISVKTVETHVSAVLRKLQLSNRHELTRWAADRPPALRLTRLAPHLPGRQLGCQVAQSWRRIPALCIRRRKAVGHRPRGRPRACPVVRIQPPCGAPGRAGLGLLCRRLLQARANFCVERVGDVDAVVGLRASAMSQHLGHDPGVEPLVVEQFGEGEGLRAAG